ncbi:uncharacterized protein CCOS01_13870 [Colletotrichum costaricense]|uniref:Uncharacterized protein n=2 Tax=Colletotrichum acutatum species complex TaxID=2707335 RepID=A0AAI9YKU1_9PEZI|nr:uncharacterized protein CCOS01_13870 [Colletotrichum costaricense]XP_060389201.1 uncharacterized protein CTAM01_00524 [Colletotrichum tamarilloi]KAK1513128.1 hypothetical protein CTAM01_00524 [Colletotrichum tamarilloi]KAK1514589.1 hypothetical protein CCOS01_13870 [Colletotrichum costaricense]
MRPKHAANVRDDDSKSIATNQYGIHCSQQRNITGIFPRESANPHPNSFRLCSLLNLTAEPPMPIFEAEGQKVPALWEQLDLRPSSLRRVTLRQGSKNQKSQTLRLAAPTMIPTPARRRLNLDQSAASPPTVGDGPDGNRDTAEPLSFPPSNQSRPRPF